MAELQTRIGQFGNQTRDSVGVGTRCTRPIHGMLEARSGDQLHCPRNLADISDRFAPFVECPGIRHFRIRLLGY